MATEKALQSSSKAGSVDASIPICGVAILLGMYAYDRLSSVADVVGFKETAAGFAQWMTSSEILALSTSVTVLYALFLSVRRDTILKACGSFDVPAALRALMPWYNLCQVAFNGWHAARLLQLGLYPWGNNAIAPTSWDPSLGMLLWLYYLNKISDLMDTVFIKLSNKNKRVTVLHSLHHVGQVWMTHLTLVVAGTSNAATEVWFPAFLNSTVHAAMYSWYLLASPLVLKSFPAMQPIVAAMKPCLTTMQMTQLVLIIVHSIQVYRYQSVPPILSLICFAWMSLLICFFLNFWNKTYNSRKNQEQSRSTTTWKSGKQFIAASGRKSSSWGMQLMDKDTNAMENLHFRSPQDMSSWVHLFERQGLIAFGMGYAKQMWDVDPAAQHYEYDPDSTAVDDALYVLSRRVYGNLRALKNRVPLLTALSWWWKDHKRGVQPSREIRDALAKEHYNLSSDVLWSSVLDEETKSYTSACFSGDDFDLSRAQTTKVDYYIDEVMGLKHKSPEARKKYKVLDIGSGWGSLVNRLSKKYPEVGVSALTHSPVQIKEYHPNVKPILADFIDHDYGENLYDCVTMIEVEHVGKDNYPILMKKIRKALKPKGIYVMQSINTAKTLDYYPDEFIERYIFRGGYIPSVHLLAGAAEVAGLKLVYTHEWDALHYEMTLEAWRRGFHANYARIVAAIGEEAARAFRIYLAFSQFSFEAGGLASHTMVYSKRGNNDGVSGVFPRGYVPCIPGPGVSPEKLATWLSSKRQLD